MAAPAPELSRHWERYRSETRPRRARVAAVAVFALAILLIWGWSIRIKFHSINWAASPEQSLWRQTARDWQASGEIVNKPSPTSSMEQQLQAALQRLQNKPTAATTP